MWNLQITPLDFSKTHLGKMCAASRWDNTDGNDESRGMKNPLIRLYILHHLLPPPHHQREGVTTKEGASAGHRNKRFFAQDYYGQQWLSLGGSHHMSAMAAYTVQIHCAVSLSHVQGSSSYQHHCIGRRWRQIDQAESASKEGLRLEETMKMVS